MKTRSLFVGFMFAILTSMIFVGGMSIAAAKRQEHRQEEWMKVYDGGERRFHWETVLGYYQNMWFHTTFVLQLDDNILVRARDVYSRALHDIHESKNTKSVNRRFLAQLKKTIGDDNFNKLMDSTADGRKRFFSRKSIRIKRWLQKRRKRGDKTDSYKEKIEKES